MIRTDIILVMLEILFAILLWVLAKTFERYENSKWKLLYLLPAFVCMILLWADDFEISMLPVYLASVIMAAGFFFEKRRIRRIFCAAGALLVVVGVMVCQGNPAYRMPDFVKGFQEAFEEMKAHYCLTEHKGIDWDGLYEKYLPVFEQANAEHDKAADLMAWHRFANEFHDGHVGFMPYDEDVAGEAEKRAFGNDYGLSLLTLTDGRVAAVNVAEGSAAYQAGIRNGSEILSWDGAAPAALLDQVEYEAITSPDIENETFYKMVQVAGLGGEGVRVGFRDQDGNEKETLLKKMGPYKDRLKNTLEIIDQGMNIGTLTWAEISEDTVLFRIKGMSYDTESYTNGDFSGLQSEMLEKIEQYKRDGKKTLILDVRSNSGGSPQMIEMMAELLGNEGEHFYVQTALLNTKTCEFEKDPQTGRYIPDVKMTYQGRGLWDHGQIIMLVNGRCISAGDHFVDMMSKMDNVTIMGMTKTNASGQAVRGVITQTGQLSFSAVPTLDENGEIYVDTGIDRLSKIPLDVKIPVDEKAVKMLFDEGEDYVLQYALDYEAAK